MPSPLFDLTGKVAVITGSSKGIGKAIAMHLALSGAKVVVSSRKAPVCEEAAAEIRKAGGHATVIPCNISDKAQCENLIAQTRKQLGPVDILCNNAGVTGYTSVADTVEENWDWIQAVNLTGPFFITQALVPQLTEGAGVVFVSSITAERARSLHTAYAATKAALLGLTKHLEELVVIQ